MTLGLHSSLICHDFATMLQMPISPTSPSVSQVDDKIHIMACGEIHVKLTRSPLSCCLQALVVPDLNCDILAGVPFMRDNDIQLVIPRNCIIIQSKHKISYNPGPTPRLEVRHTQSFWLRSQHMKPCSQVVSLRWDNRHEFSDFQTKQFFQLPMQKSSLKYLRVISLFKGLQVYTRAAMGMSSLTEHLDELMSGVIGNLMHKGKVIKIADGLYTGGKTIDDLLINWEHIVQRLLQSNLCFSATKTVVCPVTNTILIWVWSSKRIQASPHKIPHS